MSAAASSASSRKVITTTVLVSALGYFVDIYDLVLFSTVRTPSLRGIGLGDQELLEAGVYLLNMQMAGMLLGGILWGILGDKRGRLSVLFGSIFLYSAANIANGFVTSLDMYAALRFLAGVGLAGELGAAITLVSEVMPKETRGYGAAIVASVGVSGALAAGAVGDWFDWRVAYFVGGGLGLLLLLLRISVYESGMYSGMKHQSVRRGDILMLFTSRERLEKYLSCILVGVPVWYVIGVLITFSPELARELGVQGAVSGAKSIQYCYLGLVIGDMASGVLSQLMRTRRRVVGLFLGLTMLGILFYCFVTGLSVAAFYALCVALGIGTGYWALFVTIASEQFGTNLRATVTTTAPNFVRGSTILLTLAFSSLKVHLTLAQSALVVGIVCMAIATLALSRLQETFGKDLDYWEV